MRERLVAQWGHDWGQRTSCQTPRSTFVLNNLKMIITQKPSVEMAIRNKPLYCRSYKYHGISETLDLKLTYMYRTCNSVDFYASEWGIELKWISTATSFSQTRGISVKQLQNVSQTLMLKKIKYSTLWKHSFNPLNRTSNRSCSHISGKNPTMLS